MKVAVLLTGQLRTFEMLKYLHMNSLISKYNTDVFLGIDIDNKYQCVYENNTDKTKLEDVRRAIDFFKPIDTFILDNLIFSENRIEQLLLRQYYVVKNTYKMLITHSNNNNIKYDLIIRLRFDQLIFSREVPIAPELLNGTSDVIEYNQHNTDILNKYTLDKKFIFEEINDNTLYVFGFGNHKHYKYANDQFFYHNNSLTQKMFEFYDNILIIMKYCRENNIANEGALIECIFYLYITQYNNISLKHSNIKGIFVRQKKNGVNS